MTLHDTTEGDPDARGDAIDLLRSGEATVSEVARLIGVDRQLVHYWAKVERIDVIAARDRHLAKRWRAAVSKGKRRSKKPSKADRRAADVKAVASFNRKRRAKP